MAEGRIQYSNRNYNDFRNAIIEVSKRYYDDVFDNYNDASIGSWFIDIFADIADALNYHIDRVYQETSVDSANSKKSLLALAKNNGCKVPGKKAAIVEIELSCLLPIKTSNSNQTEIDWAYAPLVKRGTLFSTGTVVFELVNDVDFRQQFDENGMSDRQFFPERDSNGNITGYTIKKLAIAVAGQSKVYKRIVTASDIKPFMNVVIQDTDILGVESILVKEGTDLTADPSITEYSVESEEFNYGGGKTRRFFEVDNLIDQYRFGQVQEKVNATMTDGTNIEYYNPVWEEVGIYGDGDEPVDTIRVAKGEWKRLKQKFTTEYTDNGSLRVTFGAGLRNKYGTIPSEAQEFTKYMMSRMAANDYMGVLPEPNTTMFILYRTGGGEMSNIAKGSLTNIIYLNMVVEGNCGATDDAQNKYKVRSSLAVTNTTPSYGGKDEPSAEELRQYIKYNASAQNRCVTIHDYEAKLIDMPAKYGVPFRCGVMEENNKIAIYCLGLDANAKLTPYMSEVVAKNMKNYLSGYKVIGDFIEIKPANIINVAIDIEVFVDKAYDKAEVVKRIIELTKDYMDVRRRILGDDIYLGDLEKEISKLDGVKNFIGLKVYNRVGEYDGYAYSDDESTQEYVTKNDCSYEESTNEDVASERQIDIKASDKILYADANAMIEVKYPERDIVVTAYQR